MRKPVLDAAKRTLVGSIYTLIHSLKRLKPLREVSFSKAFTVRSDDVMSDSNEIIAVMVTSHHERVMINKLGSQDYKIEDILR